MSRRPIATIASDSHLDFTAWERREGLVGDAYHSFRQVVGKAIELGVRLMLLGDTINTKHPDSRTVEFIRRQIGRLKKAEVPLEILQGQHENAVPVWFKAISDWPDHLHQQHFAVEGTTFYGLDWTPADQLPAALEKIPPGVDVFLAHQVTEEFMGQLCKSELSLAQVPYAKLTMIGDFHEHVNIQILNRQGQPMRVYSAGSTCMRSISEPPKKGFYVLYDDLSVESFWLKTRPVLRPPQLNTPEQLDQFVEEVGSQLVQANDRAYADGLPAELCKPLLWVHYVETLENAWPRIVKAANGQAFLFKRVHLIETEEKVAQREKRQHRSARGPVAAMGELVPDHESFVYTASRRLIETDPSLVSVELQKLRAEYGVTEKV